MKASREEWLKAYAVAHPKSTYDERIRALDLKLRKDAEARKAARSNDTFAQRFEELVVEIQQLKQTIHDKDVVIFELKSENMELKHKLGLNEDIPVEYEEESPELVGWQGKDFAEKFLGYLESYVSHGWLSLPQANKYSAGFLSSRVYTRKDQPNGYGVGSEDELKKQQNAVAKFDRVLGDFQGWLKCVGRITAYNDSIKAAGKKFKEMSVRRSDESGREN